MLRLSLILLFIATVSCLPSFLSMFSTSNSCTRSIQQELDTTQGLKPDLHSAKKFGYIYRIDTPNLKLGPDMDILFSANNKTEYLPSQAAVVLSRISYESAAPAQKLLIQGRVSKLNSLRVQRNNIQGSIAILNFDTFIPTTARWHKSFNSQGFITGKVEKVNVGYQANKGDDYYELIMELSPVVEEEGILEYATVPNVKPRQMNWSVKGGCKRRMNSKRDQFHEIVESAVLL